MPLVNNSISETSLLEQLQRIETTSETSFKQKRPYISASMCQRQIMLNGTLESREVGRSPSMKYYAAIGRAIEEELVKNYENADLLLIHSWKLPKELFPEGIDLGGKIDMIIMHQSTPILIDIKTVGVVDNAAYINLKPEELIALEKGEDISIVADDERHKFTTNKKVKEAYKSQLQLYSAITGLDEIFLLSVSRRIQDGFSVGGHISAAFSRIEIPQNELEKRIAVLIYGIMARDLGKIPAPLAGLKKTHCNDAFCGFVDFCYNGGTLEQTLPTMSSDEETKIKSEALQIAKEYISTRSLRAKMTLELITNEQTKRNEINQKLAQIRKENLEPVLNEYNLYPWDGVLEVKW
jgi:hypothetical protein